MKIPFIRLERQHGSIMAEIKQAIHEVLEEQQYIRGKQVRAFEQEFAKILNVKHCIGVGNGTDALAACLKTLVIGKGDEVIVPAFTWISASEAVTACGATPVFADVNYDSFNTELPDITAKITPRTKAVILVHLYGQAADSAKIREFCDRQNLFLIEDCAQAHLTSEAGRYVGSFGHLSAFSFYPTKNLGGFGDAGCVVTSSDIYAERIRRLANHGALDKEDHLIEGFNSRLDTIQASILLVKLKYLNEWNAQRIENAHLYNKLLKDVNEVLVPAIRDATVHTFHLYVIKCRNRDSLQKHLFDHGIGTGIHYPKALPFLPAYQHLHLSPIEFPVARKLQDEVLSLPIYPGLTPDEILYVCEKIKGMY